MTATFQFWLRPQQSSQQSSQCVMSQWLCLLFVVSVSETLVQLVSDLHLPEAVWSIRVVFLHHGPKEAALQENSLTSQAIHKAAFISFSFSVSMIKAENT